MVKRIKSLIQIQKEIEQTKLKITRKEALRKAEMERRDAERQLKILKRSEGATRNIRLVRRTGRGFKKIAKAGFKLGAKQIKLIRDQQIRDEAIRTKIEKRRTKTKKGIKKIRKGAKKIRRNLPGDVLAGLDF